MLLCWLKETDWRNLLQDRRNCVHFLKQKILHSMLQNMGFNQVIDLISKFTVRISPPDDSGSNIVCGMVGLL